MHTAGVLVLFILLNVGLNVGAADAGNLGPTCGTGWRGNGPPPSLCTVESIQEAAMSGRGRIEGNDAVLFGPGDPKRSFASYRLGDAILLGGGPVDHAVLSNFYILVDVRRPPVIEERRVYVDRPVDRVVEKVVERIVRVPVETLVEVPVEKPVPYAVERIVEVPVEKVVYRDRVRTVPIERIVYRRPWIDIAAVRLPSLPTWLRVAAFLFALAVAAATVILLADMAKAIDTREILGTHPSAWKYTLATVGVVGVFGFMSAVALGMAVFTTLGTLYEVSCVLLRSARRIPRALACHLEAFLSRSVNHVTIAPDALEDAIRRKEAEVSAEMDAFQERFERFRKEHTV